MLKAQSERKKTIARGARWKTVGKREHKSVWPDGSASKISILYGIFVFCFRLSLLNSSSGAIAIVKETCLKDDALRGVWF